MFDLSPFHGSSAIVSYSAPMLSLAMINLIALLAVAACLGLGVTLLARGSASRFHRSVAGVSFAAAGVCVGTWLGDLDQADSSLGLLLCFLSELLLVVMLFNTATILNRAPDDTDRSAARWWNSAAAFMACILGIWIAVVIVFGGSHPRDGLIAGLGLAGDATHLFLLLMYVVSIAYMEGLLRTLRDPMLYQLKFVLVGLIALAGFKIFDLSQTVFHQGQRLDAATNGSAFLVAIGLMAYGFVRTQFRSLAQRIYISPHMLAGSLTFLVAGLYLFVVGVVSQVVRSSGVSFGVVCSVLFVLLALVGLTIFLLSRSARTALQTVLARNFYRAKYDYRAQWLDVTESFRGCGSVDAIWDLLLALLSRTFHAGRISVWHKIDADARFHQVRSANVEPPPEPLDASHQLIQRLESEDVSVVVETVGLPPHDYFVQATHAALCVPIRSGSELIGFIALSGEVAGSPYGQDDRDLLKAIAHHVGVLLAYVRLAEERQGSAELEALHRFSAFCLHDLKNLAARLSLVVQNAEHHGWDPTFQESAMRTVKDTADKMTTLMSKLSLKSFKPSFAGTAELVELSSLIEEIVAPLRGGEVRWHLNAETVQLFVAGREEIHQVLLNVMLNAKQAIRDEGDIWIVLSQSNGTVIVTVEDTGCGIPPEKLRSLFHPVQSSRAGGLGVGLYQCYQIVKAHRGLIQIRSEVEQGTLVRIELPVSFSSTVHSRDVTAHSVASP